MPSTIAPVFVGAAGLPIVFCWLIAQEIGTSHNGWYEMIDRFGLPVAAAVASIVITLKLGKAVLDRAWQEADRREKREQEQNERRERHDEEVRANFVALLERAVVSINESTRVMQRCQEHAGGGKPLS